MTPNENPISMVIMNPIHFKFYTPVNTPVPFSCRQENVTQYIADADESESDEEIYHDIDTDREDGQGTTKPIPIPQKQPQEWNTIHFGD